MFTLASLAFAVSLAAAAEENCWPLAPNSTGGPLTVLKAAKTPNGFSRPEKGWSSWGIQATPGTTPSYPLEELGRRGINQDFIIQQCSVLADPDIRTAGYDLCHIDGGWYQDNTDEHGRVVYNPELFDIPALTQHLHGIGLRLGIYQKPGVSCDARNKTIIGTNVTIGSTFIDVVDTNGNCYFDYDNPNTQLWHDEQIKLWASWGVDMIKVDYVTPGSNTEGSGMPANLSGTAIAYHRAIEKSGRQIRLDISSDVCRSEPYWSIWSDNADSIRVDTDINSYGENVFVGMWKVQRTIEKYRQFVNLQLLEGGPVRLRANLDQLFVGNPANVTGVTDAQRITLMSYWIGSSSNLLLGSDMKNIDRLGRHLITSQASLDASEFCSQYPMQPRNPGTGSNQAMQLQAWISGPDDKGQAYALLTNLGPSQGDGGYATIGTGAQLVSITLADLGLAGARYTATDVWSGNITAVEKGGSLSAVLGEGESRFLRLTRG